MIKKIAVLARDKPVLFFMAGFIFLLAQIIIATVALSIILKYSSSRIGGALEVALVAILFAPVLPVFFPFFLLLAERYLNFFKVGWIFGLKGNPFLQRFLRWAGVE